ncbi:N-6 DNA methylase [Fibrella aquatilis]|uniref:SAM-dependent DNA methyltransferase n=1 Tax=Fibrella aquatilis TaxID=2817059 RepID=A0A939G818_9BACT|nr:N-6 DNA methylase [Fibrella aquatilis]MBO0933919.1 SAM-dependent DNA methyltransferase [Fibrella aquatilis]
MIKSTDVPHDLRDFNKLFCQLEHGWNYGRFYADFIDFMTESFMPERVGIYENLKTQYGSLDSFVQLLRSLIKLQDQQIVKDGVGGWYDALGSYYEVLNSRGKSQWLGQFFTPPDVCDLMAMMTGADEKLTGQGQTIHDPACGSGRLLLAWQAIAPGNYTFGADVDPICTRMTAVNMALHGCEGEAVCMDSLLMEWRFGYRINAHLRATGQPTIEPITAEQSHIMNYARAKAKPAPEMPLQQVIPAKDYAKEPAKGVITGASGGTGQLQLF